MRYKVILPSSVKEALLLVFQALKFCSNFLWMTSVLRPEEHIVT